MRDVLSRSGRQVIEAATGEEGLTLATRCLPDLVICDIHLPGVSGWDVLAALRVSAATATVPVIMMTASNETTDMRQSMDRGADDFLSKPFTAIALLEAVAARQRRRDAHKRQIERTNEQQRQLLEFMEEWVAVVDTDQLTVRYLNRSAREITGLRGGGTLGTLSVQALFPESELPLIMGLAIPTALGSGSWQGDTRWRTQDGGTVPARLKIRVLGDGNERPLSFSLLARDLRHELEADDRIRLLTRAIEQNPVSIVITDARGLIEYVNPQFERVTGYASAEVIGRNPRFLKSGASPREVYEKLWGDITAGREWRGEFCNRRKDGREYWELASISPVRDASGIITHFIAVKQDITERRELELHLRQAQKLEAIGQLAAGIAHEINTPIQFIGDNLRFVAGSVARLDRLLEVCGRMLESARGGSAPPPELVDEASRAWKSAKVEFLKSEIPEAMEQTQVGVERISRIVAAMKDFSHPGTDEKTLADLNRLVESTLTVSRNEWKYVADLESTYDPALTSVPCLPAEFNQVILNLVVNAAHAMADAQAGGRTGRGVLRVVTRRVDNWAEVRVSDTGTGIPDHVREHVFEPFFTTKPVGRGSGQGLPIARAIIVEKHRGALYFETRVGEGTTFILRIPLVDPDAHGTSSAQREGRKAA